MAEFSSYNPNRDNPDVTAIGKDNRLAQAAGTTMGSDLEGPWVKASGTSFAAPEVAGMVAKFRSTQDASPKRVMEAFEGGARNIPDQPRDGAGLVDYRAALRAAGTEPSPAPPEDPATPANPDEAVVLGVGDHRIAVLGADCLGSGLYETTCEEDDGAGTVVRFVPSSARRDDR